MYASPQNEENNHMEQGLLLWICLFRQSLFCTNYCSLFSFKICSFASDSRPQSSTTLSRSPSFSSAASASISSTCSSFCLFYLAARLAMGSESDLEGAQQQSEICYIVKQTISYSPIILFSFFSFASNSFPSMQLFIVCLYSRKKSKWIQSLFLESHFSKLYYLQSLHQHKHRIQQWRLYQSFLLQIDKFKYPRKTFCLSLIIVNQEQIYYLQYCFFAMRFKVWWSQLKHKIKTSQTLKNLRRILFYQSHLSPYLPIIKEPLNDKIVRIYDDSSYLNDQAAITNHSTSHKIKKDLSKFIFISQVCHDPTNNWLIAWYSLVFIAIISTYIMTGMALFYGDQAWNDLLSNPFTVLLNVFSIIVFICDIFVQLNSGFLFRGMIIKERERSINRYIRYFLITDILLILILIISIASENFYSNIFKTIIALKFIRMFEIDKLYMRKLSTSFNGMALYVIGKQFIIIFTIAHTLGVVFYAIDLALTKRPICINNPELCWLNNSTAFSPILNYGWRIRYFYTLYWGINTITTISYGDIASQNPQETIYEVSCFCLSFVTYGYVVNNIIRIILWARTPADNFRAQLILYTTFMDNLQISREIQYQFRDYMQSRYFDEKERNFELQEEMKERLPTDLKEELLKNAYFKVNNGLEHMLFSSPSIVKLLYSLKEKKFTKNECILLQGSPITKLSYLHKGEVQLTVLHHLKSQTITSLNTTDEFLSIYQFLLEERAAYTITTSSNSTLYFIDKQKIDLQLERFTDLRENFKLVETELIFEQNYQRIYYHCYYCRGNHHWYQCHNIFPNFRDVRLNNYQHQQQRKRISLVGYNVWKNKGELQSLEQANVNITNRILRKIEERVYELKVMKQLQKNNFDVDIHHEWSYYKPNHNLSKFKEEWNKNRIRNTQPLFPAMLPLPEQPPIDFMKAFM